MWVALKRAGHVVGRVDGLGALADGVLGQLTRKQQTNGRLDLTARDRRAPVVVRQSRRLGRDALEYVVYEAVHDAHRLAADSRVRMNLLQHLVHVDRVALTSSVLPLLVCATSSLRLARRLFAPFDAAFGGIFTSKPYKKTDNEIKAEIDDRR